MLFSLFPLSSLNNRHRGTPFIQLRFFATRSRRFLSGRLSTLNCGRNEITLSLLDWSLRPSRTGVPTLQAAVELPNLNGAAECCLGGPALCNLHLQNKAHDGYSLGRVRRQPKKRHVEKRITPRPPYSNHGPQRGGLRDMWRLVANAKSFLDCNGIYPSDHES